MKSLSLIGIFLLAGWSFGQSWRDSLLSARQAYFSKQYDQAERSYRFAEKSLNGKTDLSSEKAQNAYRSGNYNAAIEQYKRGSKNAKTVAKKVDTHYNLGTAHLKQKQYKEAIQAYKNALRLDPFNKEAQYNLSQAIRKLQQSKNKQKAKDNKTKDNKRKDQTNKDKRQNDQNRENRTTKDERRNRNSQKKNAADRILDKLQKDEAATKRKLNNARSKRKGTSETSEYDW
jgi:tetratricopeptide (TPR) repeat protein